MILIVEGPKRSGKSTLIEWLAKSQVLNIIVSSEDAPPHPGPPRGLDRLLVWKRAVLSDRDMVKLASYPVTSQLIVETLSVPEGDWAGVTIVSTRPRSLRLSRYGVPLGDPSAMYRHHEPQVGRMR